VFSSLLRNGLPVAGTLGRDRTAQPNRVGAVPDRRRTGPPAARSAPIGQKPWAMIFSRSSTSSVSAPDRCWPSCWRSRSVRLRASAASPSRDARCCSSATAIGRGCWPAPRIARWLAAPGQRRSAHPAGPAGPSAPTPRQPASAPARGHGGSRPSPPPAIRRPGRRGSSDHGGRSFDPELPIGRSGAPGRVGLPTGRRNPALG
jgi:hypothetical protein